MKEELDKSCGVIYTLVLKYVTITVEMSGDGGVTEAIEQRYLCELMLVVTPTNNDLRDVIEMYTWSMGYDVDGELQAEFRQFVFDNCFS
uniref:HORMA domain-containing protein n=1 Tax=Angiostrongylus cantonensis TaxID=6313 RepID=A0A0K0D8G7_ANGCA